MPPAGDVPAHGADLLGPLLDHVPPHARVPPGGGLTGWPVAVLSGQRPRFAPRNLDFADGLDRWDLEGAQDYSAVADSQSAVPSALLSSAVPRPAGAGALIQSIFGDDYRGATVTFRGECRTRGTVTADPAGRGAGLFLRVVSGQETRTPVTERAAVNDPGNHLVMIPGDHDWAGQQVTAHIPADAGTVVFGVFLAGPGRIELRHAELTRAH